MPLLSIFLAGANTFGFLVAALLFLRAWNRIQDWFFAAFGAAFVLLGFGEFAGTMARMGAGEAGYLLRLAAFATLIAAIVGKNIRVGAKEG